MSLMFCSLLLAEQGSLKSDASFEQICLSKDTQTCTLEGYAHVDVGEIDTILNAKSVRVETSISLDISAVYNKENNSINVSSTKFSIAPNADLKLSYTAPVVPTSLLSDSSQPIKYDELFCDVVGVSFSTSALLPKGSSFKKITAFPELFQGVLDEVAQEKSAPYFSISEQLTFMIDVTKQFNYVRDCRIFKTTDEGVSLFEGFSILYIIKLMGTNPINKITITFVSSEVPKQEVPSLRFTYQEIETNVYWPLILTPIATSIIGPDYYFQNIRIKAELESPKYKKVDKPITLYVRDGGEINLDPSVNDNSVGYNKIAYVVENDGKIKHSDGRADHEYFLVQSQDPLGPKAGFPGWLLALIIIVSLVVVVGGILFILNCMGIIHVCGKEDEEFKPIP